MDSIKSSPIEILSYEKPLLLSNPTRSIPVFLSRYILPIDGVSIAQVSAVMSMSYVSVYGPPNYPEESPTTQLVSHVNQRKMVAMVVV